jgi:AraC-like DNA-binding protein
LHQALVIPREPLAAHIAGLWFQESLLSLHARERVLPDGCCELIINLQEDRLDIERGEKSGDFEVVSGSLLYGPHTRPFIINRSRPTSILGVHFHPGGLFPFINMPTDSLHNQVVTLEAIWGVQGRDLRERLLEAFSLGERFRLIERFLLEKWQLSYTSHTAVMWSLNLLRTAPHQKIKNVVEQSGLSERRFSQIFREQVGMPSKRYQRLQRFQAALHMIDQKEQVDWADLAASCGYFDQAHFVHDFRSFSGFTPSGYHQHVGRRPGHVPLY